MMIVRALEAEHYIVSTATNGPDALRMIGERMPDLVVLDYKMMGMDGMAVMKALRAKPETQAPAGADAHRDGGRAEHSRRI